MRWNFAWVDRLIRGSVNILSPVLGGSIVQAGPQGKFQLNKKRLSGILLISTGSGALVLSCVGFLFGNILSLVTIGKPLAWLLLIGLSLLAGIGFIVILTVMALFIILLLALPLLFLRLVWTKSFQDSPKPDFVLMPAAVSCALMVAFCAGAFLAVVLWRGIGSIVFQRARAGVLAAGYRVELPPVQKKNPGEDNAITWLRRAEEALSRTGFHSSAKQGKSPKDFLHAFLDQAAQERLAKGAVEEATRIMAANREALNLLEKAIRAREVNWGIDYGKPFHEIEIPRFVPLRDLALLQASQAVLLANSGRSQEAADKLRTGFWLAQVAAHYPMLIGSLVGVAISETDLKAAQFLLRKIPAQIARKAWEPYLRPDEEAVRVKRSLVLELFASGDEISRMGWLQMIRIGLIPGGGASSGLAGLVYWPFLGFDVAAHHRHSLQALGCLDLSYPQMQSCLSKNEEDLTKNLWLLGQISYPFVRSYYVRGLMSTARLRLARLALVAKEYRERRGVWPESLDQLEVGKGLLQDPFSEGRLRLKREGQHLLLYSVGKDGVDDQAADYNPATDRGDIVWRL